MNAPVYLSITQIASEFSVSRDAARKLLAEAGVEPSGKGERGHPTYRLRDVRQALDGERSPDNMTPFEQRAYWAAKEKRIEVETLERQRIPIGDVEAALGSVIAAQSAGSVVDELERTQAVVDHRVLTALDDALAMWALRQYDAIAAICERVGFSKALAARALPSGHAAPEDGNDERSDTRDRSFIGRSEGDVRRDSESACI